MTTDPITRTVGPDPSEFAYPDFYRAMIEREHLQVLRDEVVWSEWPEPGERPVDVLLNFGCNVRQTPHLQREAVAVFEVLGVDFAAVAGQQFCCGKPYTNNNIPETAKRVVERSVERMSAYRPTRAIQWCSACEMQFQDLVVPNVGIRFQSNGVAEFLLDRLSALGQEVPWKDHVRIAAVVHGHLGQHAVRDAHPEIAMRLLEEIPGVEVVSLASTPALNICDNSGVGIAAIGTEAYLAAQAELEGYLEESGADTIITLYHGCTRELGKFASDRLSVRHYISVLAEALGVSKPDRFSEYWRMGDPRKVMEASRSNWESWGITEDEALRLAHKHFVPSYAAKAPECPCNGQCTRTGARWLEPYRRETTRASG